METNKTVGIPRVITIFLLNPFLKIAIFAKLLDKWKSAVIAKTELKSRKKFAIGTKKTEDPNPPKVPRISANKVRIIKTGRKFSSIRSEI
jgi:hypothetical protein